MPLTLTQRDESRLLMVTATGTISREDYENFSPVVEEMIEKHGKIRVLFEMRDFHGWNVGGVWEDIKFDIRHFSDIEKLALVGDKQWEKWMASFCKPFTRAEIRYFEEDSRDDAVAWIQGE